MIYRRAGDYKRSSRAEGCPEKMNKLLEFGAMKGLLRPVFAGSLLLLAIVGQAQSARDAALQSCLEIERDQDRLECLENQLRQETPASSALESTPRPAAAPEPPIAVAAPAAGQTPARTASPVPSPEERRAEDRRAESEGRGRERPPEVTLLTIVEVTETALGTKYFTTSDGDVYRKTSRDAGRYPPVPFEARLTPASAGSYFMETARGGPPIRISLAQ